MSLLNSRGVKLGILGLAVGAIVVNIALFSRNTAVGATRSLPRGGAPVNGTGLSSARTPIPPEGIAANDTQGTVPGNPALTVAQMKALHGYFQTYRQRHGGRYPNPQVREGYYLDMLMNPKAYGLADLKAADKAVKTRM